MTRRILGWGALALLALTIAWEAYSPYRTLGALRDAARDRDSAAFSENIDYPSLRASIKETMRAAFAARIAKDPRANAMGAAFATALLDPMIDNMVTPQMVEASFRRQDGRKNPLGDTAASPEVEIDRQGLNAFTVADPKNPGSPKLLFRRSWPTWKLSGIQIPESAFAEVR